MTKNAFTLIELLAVIIVLSVIALITIPAITTILKDSKEKSVEISAKNYASSLNNCLSTLDIQGRMIGDNIYEISYFDDYCSSYMKGQLPNSGSVEIEDFHVIAYHLVFEGKEVDFNWSNN